MEHRNLFKVEIVTEDKITDDNEINEMSQNIANAIIDKIKHGEVGIVPENSESFVKIVYVKSWYSDKEIIEHPY